MARAGEDERGASRLHRGRVIEAEMSDDFAFEEFELAQTVSRIGVGLVDTNLRFIRVNVVMADIHGLDVHQHVGKSIQEVLPVLAPDIERDMRAVIHEGVPRTDVIVTGTSPGSMGQRSWLAHYYPHRNAAGTLTGVFCVVRDSTEATTNSRADMEAQKRWAVALEGSAVGIWELNVEAGTFWRSGVQLQNLASPSAPAKQASADWANAVHPDDMASQAQALLHHIRERTPYYETEIRLRTGDDQWSWFLARGKVTEWLPDGSPRLVTGTALDIAERKRDELDRIFLAELSATLAEPLDEQAAISKTVNSLAMHLDKAQIAYAEVDAHRDLILLKPEYASWPIAATMSVRLKCDDNWVTTTFGGLLKRSETSEALTEMNAVLDRLGWRAAFTVPFKRQQSIFGTLLVRADGPLASSDCCPSVVYAAITQLVDTILRIRSDLARVRAEEEVQRLLRFGAMSALASTLAHELNQPLAASANLLGVAEEEVMSGRSPASDLLRQVVSKASDQILRAGKLVHRMRDFAMTGAAKLERGSLSDALDIAHRSLEHLMRQQGIAFTRSAPHLLPDIDLDKIQIVQVISNLMRNAIDAVEGSDGAEISAAIDVKDQFIKLSISDNGKGLSQEAEESLFQPFKSLKREGMGLGLTVCKTIVDAHGGDLTAQNIKAGGACFTMSLPLP